MITVSVDMKFQLVAFSLLFPALAIAEPIVALQWSPAANRLVVAMPSEIHLMSAEEVTTFAAPSQTINDVTLFDNDSQLLIGTNEGVYVSPLKSGEWSSLNAGLESNSVEFVFTNVELQNVLYAATQDIVYKLTPDENNWVNMDAGPGGEVTDYLHTNMPDSMETGWIFTSTTNGVAFTADCFCFWRDVRNFDHSVLAMTYQPDEPSWLYAATKDSLFESKDGARTWQKLVTIPVRNATALTSAGKNQFYLGTSDGELYRLDYAALTWTKVNEF